MAQPTADTRRRNTHACPICGDHARHELRWRLGYSIWSCLACKLLFTHPLPTDEQLQDFYAGFMYRQTDDAARQQLIAEKKQELTKLFLLRHKEGQPLSFLDFGGGNGIGLAAALELGLDAYYYEIDPQAADHVRQSLGRDASRVLDDPFADDRRFDLIFCDNVIEHVRDPLELTRRLTGRLSEHGTLVVKTPHARDTQHWFYPAVSAKYYAREAARHNRWTKAPAVWCRRLWPCDPPRHLYAFTATSLRRLASQAGYDQCDIDYYPIPLFEYRAFRPSRDKPTTLKSSLKSLATQLLAPVEVAARLTQVPLLACRVLTPGGILLRVHNGHPASA